MLIESRKRKLRERSPQRRQFVRNPARRRSPVRQNSRGVLTSFLDDNASRLTGRQYSDGTPRVTQAYDPAGNRNLLQDGTGTTTQTYDAANQPLAVTNPSGKTVSYTWDAASDRATMVTPDGQTFTYIRDAASRLANLVNPQGAVTTFVNDAADRRVGMVLANGTSVTMAYDNANQLLLLASLSSTGTTLISSSYAYDPAGTRGGMTENRQGNASIVTWTHDAAYQLTGEQRTGTLTYDISHAYDPVGNRNVMTSGGTPTTFAFDAANQLQTSVSSAGTTTFQFDNAGNQQLTILPAGGGTTTNTWDGENQLVQVALPGGSFNTGVFNGDGLRVAVADSTGTRSIIWDGQAYLLETAPSGMTTAVYTNEPTPFGSLISQFHAGQPSYYHLDGIGSASSSQTVPELSPTAIATRPTGRRWAPARAI